MEIELLLNCIKLSSELSSEHTQSCGWDRTLISTQERNYSDASVTSSTITLNKIYC